MTVPHELLDDEEAQDRTDAKRATIVTVVSLAVIVVACVTAAMAGIPSA